MSKTQLSDWPPGRMFTYEGKRQLLRKGVGIGQVLATDAGRQLVFVELFGTRNDEIVPFIGFVPLTFEAFVRSKPILAKLLDVPKEWESRRNLWLGRWQTGEAGVFAIPLREIAVDAVKTVARNADLDEGKIYIEAAFPRRDESGSFRVIETHVVDVA